MDFNELKQQTKSYLDICYPALENSSPLVEECFDNALQAFSKEFICQLRPESWARITLTYHKHFLESGIDISIAEIFSVVMRDSIQNNRMDFLTQSLAQDKAFKRQQEERDKKPTKKAPKLSIVKPTK